MSKKTLNLVDGYGYVFRAYYALPPMMDPNGTPVGAVFGFCRMLLNLIEKYKGEPLAVVFDSGGKNHRHTIYPDYKAHRPTPAEDLIVQFPLVREVCVALGVSVIEQANQEADDLIATYARLAKKEGYHVNIISSDKDLMQLVDSHITMFDPIKNKTIEIKDVVEKFGVPPSQMVDLQALMGDSTDNIPGVPGVGPKTAKQLITEFGSLDKLYAHINKIPESKRKESLIAHKDLAYISKKLVALIDLKPEHDVHNFAVHSDVNKTKIFLEQYGFKSLLKKFDIDHVAHQPHEDKNPSRNEGADQSQFAGLLVFADLKSELENNPGLDPFQVHDLASLSLSLFQGKFKPTVLDIQAELEIPNASVSELFATLYGVAIERKVIDNYLTCDRFMPFVLVEMEKVGICVDLEYLEQLRSKYTLSLKSVEEVIYKLAGCEFNINSPKQLGHILYEKNNFLVATKTKTGQLSTDADTLQKLADHGYDLPRKILEYRGFAKILSTYVQPLIDKADKGRVHTTFSHTQTLTGRLASSNPNLQNIPIRTGDGRAVRRAFVASSQDNVLISFDYSQIELRLLAHYSEDSALIDAFHKGKDIHSMAAEHLFGKVTEVTRRMAKTVNFGIVYGISAYGLAENLNISRSEAQNIIDSYFKRYPGVKTYIENQIHLARRQGYVTTITDRPIYIVDINSRNAAQRQFAERQATNAPLQGSNAELIKRAMVKIHFWLKEEKLGAKMVLQIHDELIFDVPKTDIEKIQKYVTKVMTKIYPLKVPLVVDCGVGNTWLQAK